MTNIRLNLLCLFLALVFSGAIARGQQGGPGASAPAAVSADKVITEYAPPPEQYRKAAAYSAAHYRHFFVNTFYGFLVLLAILHWRLAAKYRGWAERISRRRFLQALIFAPALLLTVAVLGLPSDIWDQWLDRDFGLSVQSWGSWLVDWTTNEFSVLVVGTILIWILYAVIRRSPRRWWLYFWIASIPILLAVFFLQPLVLQPLFFKFTPLQAQQPELVAALERVVQHGGLVVPPERMFEMNSSSKVTELSGYVAGFGASKRVVISDTLVAKLTPPEILFVFGHEMGHYALGHIPQETMIAAFILLVLLYAAWRVVDWMLVRWGTNWGIRGPDDWASLPALFLVLTVLAFLATPAWNAVSRHFEHEADRYGLEAIHGIVPDPGQAAARALLKVGEADLIDPNPSAMAKFWMFDHPTRPERVHFVVSYDPWSAGAQPRYVR